jgi:Ethylbenzene dehydrogenase/Prokaryotic cytochrome b561
MVDLSIGSTRTLERVKSINSTSTGEIKQPALDSAGKPVVKPPRSDIGTVILHWVTTIAMIASMVTGLRISADAEGAYFAPLLEPILPQGEIWSIHIYSALTLIACIIAYTLYMARSGLKRRVSLRRTVVFTVPVAPKLRWAATNVVLHWVLFATVMVLLASGVALYLGYGGWIVTVHFVSTMVAAAYIVGHLFSHFMYGGLQQWLRLFRPMKLAANRAMRERPLLLAALSGVVVVGAAAAVDFATRDTIAVPRMTGTPKLDGNLDEPFWAQARVVTIETHQGSHLGGTGTSTVKVRAVHDGDMIHFAFQWSDPTRSLKRLPVIKREDGWHLLHNKADLADESKYYEDKFAVMFSKGDGLGTDGATHLGPKPLANLPAAQNGRGLHFTTDGSVKDVWQWKASRGGLLGRVDDMYFAEPSPANQAQTRGVGRYSGGYDNDPGKSFYIYNYVSEGPGGYRGPVKLRRLPLDYKAIVAKMGKIDLDPEATDDEGSQWWMFENETALYSAELDAKIPVGTVLPTPLIIGVYEGSRADLTGNARWKDGWWTLEVSRKIKTGNARDLDLDGTTYMWMSVFDHNQVRHTRHMRPVKLELR